MLLILEISSRGYFSSSNRSASFPVDTVTFLFMMPRYLHGFSVLVFKASKFLSPHSVMLEISLCIVNPCTRYHSGASEPLIKGTPASFNCFMISLRKLYHFILLPSSILILFQYVLRLASRSGSNCEGI